MKCTPRDADQLLVRGIRVTATAMLAGLVTLAVLFAALPARGQSDAQPASQSPPAFAKLVGQMAPSDGADENPKSKIAEQQALAMLDGVALAALNAPSPNLESLNRMLATYVTRTPPLGESYRAFRLPGTAPTYAIAADFGPDGPSAVRIYTGAPGQLKLAAQVDRYTQMDFLDDYIELVPWNGPETVFITVSGRTDELETGIFTAWHFDGHQVQSVWTSDVLQLSTYELASDGFRVTFCADEDPDDIHSCLGMQRDRYQWKDGKWAWVESTKLPGTGAKATVVK